MEQQGHELCHAILQADVGAHNLVSRVLSLGVRVLGLSVDHQEVCCEVVKALPENSRGRRLSALDNRRCCALVLLEPLQSSITHLESRFHGAQLAL